MSARLRNLNPYELHKYLVNVYCLNAKGSTELLKRDTTKDKTDLDVIRENHRFLWEDDDVADTWEKQLSKKYYDKLFKEYCICDLSRYQENKIYPDVDPVPKITRKATLKLGINLFVCDAGPYAKAEMGTVPNVALRWRIEQEVVLGKGQFQCGNKKCINDQGLKSWEVNFAYLEDREKKNALVKLRLCPECSEKLNYKSKKREIKRLKKTNKKAKKNRRKESSDKEESGEDFSPRTPEPEEPSISTETTEADESNESLWRKDVQETEEKSREEEFQEYLEDLLL